LSQSRPLLVIATVCGEAAATQPFNCTVNCRWCRRCRLAPLHYTLLLSSPLFSSLFSLSLKQQLHRKSALAKFTDIFLCWNNYGAELEAKTRIGLRTDRQTDRPTDSCYYICLGHRENICNHKNKKNNGK